MEKTLGAALSAESGSDGGSLAVLTLGLLPDRTGTGILDPDGGAEAGRTTRGEGGVVGTGPWKSVLVLGTGMPLAVPFPLVASDFFDFLGFLALAAAAALAYEGPAALSANAWT